ncbi:MATH domain containing protein [Histomonas meleagridis]|uniref:MATH domain containing protein n=1 Tax=Histomonas meleagridis TaxID=135588 RepID=UPI0035598C22|nr:MATH domain containing protein [Histomonas meleagridis]KAH0803517.1 MATH domain containing protein [Histomonas meleagridis]
MKNIQLAIEEAELILTNNDQKSAIAGEEFLQKMDKTLDDYKPVIVGPPSTEWTNELVPPFKKLKFKIPNFKQYHDMFKKCKNEDVRYLYSPNAKLYGAVWRAKIYPNGNSNGLQTHLSVYIELIKGISSSSFVYRVEIESKKPNYEKVVKQYVSTFEEMDSWGWNKVIPLETLFDGYIDENGSVSFEISLRPESYLVCARRSAEELEKVKEKCKKLKQELREKGVDPNSECVSETNEINNV